MSENNLDEFVVEDENAIHGEDLASNGQRFANYFIDVIIYFAFSVFLVILLGAESPGVNFGYLFFALYYIILELTTGKTVGKMVTGTKVVTTSGEPLQLKDVLIRTVCRIVPFESLSIFFGKENTMWHDQWSDTRVVKERK